MIVNLVDFDNEKGYLCPLVKNSAIASKISLYKGWIEYLDQAKPNMRVKDKFRFQFHYPSSSISVKIIRKKP